MAFDPTSYPYDTVVRITDTIGGVGYQASGVLISPDEVLTASHVVYTAGVGTASNIVVTPAYSNGIAPYGSANGAYIHYFPINDANGQISNYDSQSDYAVIHLSSSFTTNGTMGLLANFSGGAVTIAGYPASAAGTMIASNQTVILDRRYSLLDGIALGKGSSGGPVFVGGASNPQVVGIVSSESNGNDTGYNTLITAAAFKQIEQWIAGDDATTVTAPPKPTPQHVSVTVRGTHTQYIVTDNAGSLYYQDLVSNRDGTQTKPGVDEIVFTDGVGRFDSTGNAEEVARLYATALGRGADLAELNGWTDRIDANTLQLGNVAMAFIQSAEFKSRYGAPANQAFVQQVYQNALGRAPDQAGLTYWTGALNAGVSRAAVVIAVSESFEHKQDMLATVGDADIAATYRLYQAAYGRTADTGGWAYWTEALDAGAGVGQVAQAFTQSAEYASMFAGLSATATVNQFYENTFHRAGDPAGVNYWARQLQAGASTGQILLEFSESPENRVATASVTHDAWAYTTG